MRRSEEREKYIIYTAVILLCLVMATFWLMSNIYARYVTSSSGEDSARVAQFHITESGAATKTINVTLQLGEKEEYPVEITNDSEVTIAYEIDVQNKYKNLPLETCDCEGHTASISINATSTYHDGNEHPAVVTTTGDILGSVSNVVYTYKEQKSDTEYGSMPEGTKIPKNKGFYKAVISLEGKEVSVEYEIKSPADGIDIESSKAKGQRFGDIDNESSLSVAKGDAFTVQFDVQNLNQEAQVYITAPVLKLSEALPSGTTMIMQANDEYWYCKSPSGTEIQLSSFHKMGDSAVSFKYNTENITASQKYRFIIDCSKVSENDLLNDDISLTLEYKNTESENVSGTTTVSFGAKAAFEVTSSNDTLKATAPANDPYTHWENKTMVWKISNNDSNTKLPSDAKLTVSTMNAGETQTSIYQQNQSGEFVIPFIWSNSKEFKISLDSEQAGWKGKTYTLKAELFVGNYTNNSLSLPQAAEGNTAAGSTTINVKIAQDTSPAVRITGTQRIMTVSKGSDTTLDLNVETKNTEAYQLSATIEQKNNGEYTGKFLETDVTDGENKFSIGGITTAGSYRLLVRVIKDNQIIMTVPYYFIVKY